MKIFQNTLGVTKITFGENLFLFGVLEITFGVLGAGLFMTKKNKARTYIVLALLIISTDKRICYFIITLRTVLPCLRITKPLDGPFSSRPCRS